LCEHDEPWLCSVDPQLYVVAPKLLGTGKCESTNAPCGEQRENPLGPGAQERHHDISRDDPFSLEAGGGFDCLERHVPERKAGAHALARDGSKSLVVRPFMSQTLHDVCREVEATGGSQRATGGVY